MTKLESLIKDLTDISEQIVAEESNLNKSMSNADKELVDMYHYIEFSNFNAAQGYKAYKELQNVLKKRRVIKNDIKLLNDVKANYAGLKTIRTDCAISDLNIESQSYTPRVRDDLFNNKPIAKRGYDFVLEGIPEMYLNKKIIRTTKAKTVEYNDLYEAVASRCVGTITSNTYKKIAKKIIKAHLTGIKYDSAKWTIYS